MFFPCDMKLENLYQCPNFVRFPVFQCTNIDFQLFGLKLYIAVVLFVFLFPCELRSRKAFIFA